MKRRISLILVVALLASLLVLPASAETTAGFKMSVVYFTEDTSRPEMIEGEEASTLKAGDLIALRLDYANDATPRWVTGYGAKILFDSSALELYSFKGGKNNRTTVGPQVGGLGGSPVYKAAEGSIAISEGAAYGLETGANEVLPLAWVLFKVLDGAESGGISFTIDPTFENDLSGSLTEDGAVASFEGINFSDSKEVTVNGVAPTIKSVAIDPDTATYGQAGEYELKVLSTKDKDITSLVDWAVSPADKGVSVTAGKLTVTAEAPAGTYTVTASGKGDESQGTASADFTIAPKTVTNPTLTVVGFGKGAAVGDVQYSANDLNAVPSWYEGEGDPSTLTPVSATDKFKADTTYTLVLTLTPANDNYVLDPDTTVTVMNFGEERTVALKSGVAVIAAKTDAKTALKIVDYPSVNPQAHYGMKLNELTISGGKVIVNGDKTETAIAGHFEWVNPNQDVGEPTVDNKDNPRRGFDAKFVPDKGDEYAELPVKLSVDVHKISIDISSVTQWNYMSPLKYNGSEQTVELVIPETLKNKDQLDITYTGNKGTNVGTYNATAEFGVKDEARYMIFNTDKTRSLNEWKIEKGTLSGSLTCELKLSYGADANQTVSLTSFGLPANETYKLESTESVTDADGILKSDSISVDNSENPKAIQFQLNVLTVSNVDDEATVVFNFSADNYENFQITLKIKIVDKTTDTETLQITLPEGPIVYGDTVTPGVASIPEGAGKVTYKFFDKDGKEVTAQPFNAGPYKVTATCESESTIYTAEKTFTVEPRELKEENVFFEDLVYTGEPQKLVVTVKINGEPLTGGTDYVVTSEVVTEVGEYPVTVEGQGNYTGKVEMKFRVKQAAITAADIEAITGQSYTGSQLKPEVTVRVGGKTLTAGTDYDVSYGANLNVKDGGSVTVTGKGNYTGTATKTFDIAPKILNMGPHYVTITGNYTYNGKEQKPEVNEITTTDFTIEKIKKDVDYTVAYENNVNAGENTAKIKIAPVENGNFSFAAFEKTFTINKADLTLNGLTLSSLYTETEEKTADLSPVGFCAGELTTGFTVAIGEPGNAAIFTKKPAVVSGENKVTYQLSGTIGTAVLTVTVTPTSANYNPGTYTLTIEANDKTNVSGRITFESGSAVYTGSGIAYEKATISGLSAAMTYRYAADTSTGAELDAAGLPLTVGTYNVTAVYSDAYNYGTKSVTFTIAQATPTGTPSFTKIEASGKTLADAALTVGTIRPAGTIAWDLPATTEVEANKEYTWTFTPTDTHNYKPLTGRLTPYVVSDMSYLPGVIGNTGSFSFHDVSRFDYFYDAVKWASENGIASGTSNYTFSPDAICTRAQTVTFLWRAAGSPMPRYRVSPFTDVNAYDYYYNAVLWAVEQGITTGLTATTFGPDETVTRGQVATFLYRAASAAKPNTFNPFTDVKATAYNYDAILWAYDNRITTGTSTTTFSPDASCTRAQIVTFLYRYYQGR